MHKIYMKKIVILLLLLSIILKLKISSNFILELHYEHLIDSISEIIDLFIFLYIIGNKLIPICFYEIL
jgi:uncharacterized membrane protein